MITLRITAEVKDDRRVVLTLPPEVPIGVTELIVTVNSPISARTSSACAAIAHAAQNENTIQIVDCGRGPQLSTCRITVQDLVPYIQQECTYDEILKVMPVLTVEEIQVVQQYVRDHYDAVMEQDRRIRDRNAQRKTSPEIQAIRSKGRARALELMDRFAKQKARENGGDDAPR